MEISIAKDFSPVPAGRYRSDGEFSGQRFREEYLKPKLEEATKDDPLIVDIDCEGFGSSFLEEAFGGLVRQEGCNPSDLKERLRISAGSGYAIYTDIIWTYINNG